MIEKQVRADIFTSDCRHIVFAVNTEGFNDAGFAGLVARRFWPDLAITGEQKLGTVLTHKGANKIFHAVVCHSLKKGWDGAPKAIEDALNQIDVKDGDTIGVVMMGAGPIGLMQGADVQANLGAMEKSVRKVVVYSL